MKILIVTQILFWGAIAGTALAQDAGVNIPQVSSIPNPKAKEIATPAPPRSNPGDNTDYQQNVLSNPTISDIARANSLTNGGGNTSAVVQDGSTAAPQDTKQTDHNTQPPTQN
jgi:hypothetical protein